MSDKKVVDTKTSVDTKTTTEKDGTLKKVITTTTVETFSDGSKSTKTEIKTITEGIKQRKDSKGEWVSNNIDPNSLDKDPLTTDDDYLEESLKAHNDYRKKHGASPLVLDKEMCKVAQAWANKIAKKGQLDHSNNGYGENVFWTSKNLKDGKEAVDKWYSENEQFDWENGEFQKGTGHFTQVVWKGSKKLGIAKAHGGDGSTYVVANYDPPGNFLGQFKGNVEKSSILSYVKGVIGKK